MIACDFERIIQMMVEKLLPKTSPEIKYENNQTTIIKDALLFNLEIMGEGWDKEEQEFYRISIPFYMIFSGNVNVFFADASTDSDDRWKLEPEEIKEWVNTSNHDSCWKTDGFQPVNDIYFKILDHLREKKFEDIRVYGRFGVIDTTWPKNVKIHLKAQDYPRYKLLKIEYKDND